MVGRGGERAMAGEEVTGDQGVVQGIRMESLTSTRSKGGKGNKDEGGRGHRCHRVDSFPPESFDRVLLDGPCSALGLRPRLRMDTTRKELEDSAETQRRLFSTAVALLKPGSLPFFLLLGGLLVPAPTPTYQLTHSATHVLDRPCLRGTGGVLVYSTCTVSPLENEAQVALALTAHPSLTLRPLPAFAAIGSPGLLGHGLTDDQCRLVQRFVPTCDLEEVYVDGREAGGGHEGPKCNNESTNGPTNASGEQLRRSCQDSIGFFVAAFTKR